MALISLNPATNKVIKKHYVHKDLEIKKNTRICNQIPKILE